MTFLILAAHGIFNFIPIPTGAALLYPACFWIEDPSRNRLLLNDISAINSTRFFDYFFLLDKKKILKNCLKHLKNLIIVSFWVEGGGGEEGGLTDRYLGHGLFLFFKYMRMNFTCTYPCVQIFFLILISMRLNRLQYYFFITLFFRSTDPW